MESVTCLFEVNWFVSSSCLHQQLVRKDAIVRSVPVVVDCDAASLPVLIKSLLKTCEKTNCYLHKTMQITQH